MTIRSSQHSPCLPKTSSGSPIRSKPPALAMSRTSREFEAMMVNLTSKGSNTTLSLGLEPL